MRKAPLVIIGTVTGLAAVLSFHSSTPALSFGTTPGTPTTTTPTTTAPATTPTSRSGRRTTSTTPTTTAPVTASGARSATGPSVNYYFGVLRVKVTASGTKITNVTIANLSDGGNYRSQSIDSASIPQLESQALALQSANIQGVSGASYTSAGFKQSLQGALTQLGL